MDKLELEEILGAELSSVEDRMEEFEDPGPGLLSTSPGLRSKMNTMNINRHIIIHEQYSSKYVIHICSSTGIYGRENNTTKYGKMLHFCTRVSFRDCLSPICSD